MMPNEFWTAADVIGRKDAEIARLTAALEASQAHIEKIASERDDVVNRLAAERDTLRAAIFGGANYASDLRTGNFVEMAQTLHAAQKGGLERAEKAEADLATARAETAMAYAAAAERAARRWAIRKEHADKLYEMDYPEAAIDSRTVSAKADEAESIAEEIRALAPAHATEALAAYRKAVRVQALREAMAACLDRDDRAFILALIEKEGGNG
jgi:hypothetical protein